VIDNFVTVTTFLWKDPARQRSYDCSGEHVLILKNMVDRHLTVPHEFVCFVQPEILQEQYRWFRDWGIRTVPLEMTTHIPGTCFVRLALRNPRMAGILGKRAFQLDLDVAIVSNIDELVLHPAKNVWWKNPNYPAPKRAYFQTSVQLLTPGTLSELYKDFSPTFTPRWVNRRFGGAEQAWVSERLNWEDQAIWTEADGIYGSARLVGGVDRHKDPGVGTDLPSNARIVSFPGDRAPWQPEMKKLHPWIEEFYR
jgi:hypothetical protein